MSPRRFSYATLMRQRMLVAGLTLGLITVISGVMIDIILTNQRTTIPPNVRRLIVPLDPQLDLETVQTLESYESISLSEARRGVQTSIEQRGAAADSLAQDREGQQIDSADQVSGAAIDAAAPTTTDSTTNLNPDTPVSSQPGDTSEPIDAPSEPSLDSGTATGTGTDTGVQEPAFDPSFGITLDDL